MNRKVSNSYRQKTELKFFLNKLVILVYNYLLDELISAINFGFDQDIVDLIQATVNMLHLELTLETISVLYKFASVPNDTYHYLK